MTARFWANVFVDSRKYCLVTLTSLLVTIVLMDTSLAIQSNQSFASRADSESSQPPPRLNQNGIDGSNLGSHTSSTMNSPVTKLTLSGRFHLVTGTRRGVLILKVQIPEGKHIYSMTQSGNPPPSEIKALKSKQFRIQGSFKTDRHPKVIESDPVFENRIEKHHGLVQFYVPIEISSGIDPTQIKPEIMFDGQICSDEGTCMPIRDLKTVAVFAGYYEQQAQRRTDSKNQRH